MSGRSIVVKSIATHSLQVTGACSPARQVLQVKSLRYDQNGEPGEVLRLVDAATPTITSGGVIVALEAAPVHIADLKAVRGDLAFIPRGGGVPGFEGVGRVIACGPGERRWKAGDRVILPMAYGAWQEELSVRSDALWRAPDGVPAEQLALARINLSTAYLLLNAYEALAPGDWIIQNAANANVAHYVHMLAADRGISVIDLVRRPELVAALGASGRRHVLVDQAGLAGIVKDRWGISPRLAFDAIGGGATARLGNCVCDGGLVLAYGFLAESAYRIDYPDMMFRDVRLRGMMTDRAIERIGADGVQSMMACLEAAMASSLMHADIAGIYPFSDFRAALAHAAATGAARQGKVILVPDPA
jgi:NADPH:quinone reductase-like Zn-dependent oxidoreductase